MSRRTKLLFSAAILLAGLALWAVYRGPSVRPAPSGSGAVTAPTAAAGQTGGKGGTTGTAGTPAATASGNAAQMSSGPASAPDPADGSGPPVAPASGGAAAPPVFPPAGGADGSPGGPPPRTIADILEGADLSDPAQRDRAVAEIAALESARKQAGVARARELGLPLRVERPDGTVQEVAGLDDDGHPLYFTTHNVSAAISTGANVLQAAPYDLRGTSALFLGVWDGGSARATHQEFGGRVSVRDGSGSIDHATHVAGTMIAAGVTASAKGMAPAAPVASYDWNSDKSEMTTAGAATATEAINATDKFLISNHSYGFIAGWNYVAAGSPYRVWEWYGNGTTAASVEADFGLYSTQARESDALAFTAPYLLMFRSAGNERNNNPSAGQAVALSPGSTSVVNYDPAVHPTGDGTYRGGFETISFDAVAKNVLTVGSVLDAVTSGLRDPSKAAPSSFTSYGPTDDGRIKPDLVANGESVYSSLNSGDASYGTYSGTSMSSPNAAGTAALLAQEYVRLFGQAMRASTLKGLLIHTADDRGNAGPDYKHGWGLINGKAAADLVRDHHANALKVRLTEGTMPTNGTTMTHEFVWDGSSPIRATMCWTDPAGTSTTISDLRSARLRNNLDLKIVAPDGTQHLPYTMPFVGTWTQASMDLPATTGINNTDNVEQVYVDAPGAPGVYRAVVSFQGTLANNQVYSLLISGSANEIPPPPALALESVSPDSGTAGSVVTLQLSGAALSSATSVQLTKDGQTAINATSLSMAGEQLVCQVNLAGAAVGTWNVVAGNGSETSTLLNAFTVVAALYGESFDGTVTGWSSSSVRGSNAWILASNNFKSPPRSYFCPAPASQTTTYLVSAPIVIPAGASGLQFKFWHSYNLESRRDGGRVEVSVDNGATWFGVDSSGSGVVFASNGYNNTIRNGTTSDFGRGTSVWTGNSGGFVETVLSVTDNAKFAGKTVRLRWGLATNISNLSSSIGWYVDSVALFGNADLLNQPPSVVTQANVPDAGTVTDPGSGITYSLVASAGAPLSVSAADDGGVENLDYRWTATGPGPVFFSPNGGNAASSTQADFEVLGDYQINVTMTDTGGLSATSTVYVRVEMAASSVRVSPPSASLGVGGAQQFGAVLLDQFGGEMDSSAAVFTWTVTGGGSVTSSGLFTATQAGENFAVVAATTLPDGTVSRTLETGGPAPDSEASDFAQVTVTPGAATVMLGNLAQVYDGLPKPLAVTTDPPELSVSVTYNGNLSAPSAAGTYAVEAVVTDPNYQGGASGMLVVELSAFDAWRLENFGEWWESNPDSVSSADADGDGADNHAEFYLGTDPADPGSRLRISVAPMNSSAATVTISPAVTEGVYLLKSWSDLTQTPVTASLEITGKAESASFEVPAAADRNFYQLLYTPPVGRGGLPMP
ncbi:MAG: S8 family serine peptidase [Chthoniobacterales bacterium]